MNEHYHISPQKGVIGNMSSLWHWREEEREIGENVIYKKGFLLIRRVLNIIVKN